MTLAPVHDDATGSRQLRLTHRNRRFESSPLHRRVCELLVPKRRSPQIQAVRVRSGIRILSAFHVRRDKAALFQWVQAVRCELEASRRDHYDRKA